MDADWTMVIITAIYVIATIAICFFNAKSAKAAREQTEISKKQIEEMIRQYKEINRPIVTIRFEVISSSLLCFILENEGPLPAHNITVTCNDSFIDNLEDERTKNHLQKLKQAKLFLASHQKMIIPLDAKSMFSDIAKELAVIKITYDNFEELTEIDLNQYEMFLIDESPLEDISHQLKKMIEQDKQFYSKLLEEIPAKERKVSDDALKYRLYKQICMNSGCTIQSLCDLYPEQHKKIAKVIDELKNVEGWIDCRPINSLSDTMLYGCYKK